MRAGLLPANDLLILQVNAQGQPAASSVRRKEFSVIFCGRIRQPVMLSSQMCPPKRAVFIFAAWAVCAGGCGSTSENAAGGAGGAHLGGTGGISAAGSGGAPTTLGADGFPSECLEAPTLPSAAQGEVNIDLVPMLDGKPLVMGEENALSAGGTLMPTNLRFYLSGFEFKSGAKKVPAFLVDSEGKPLRYGVQFVELTTPSSRNFKLRVAPGSYDEMSFILGLTAGCNETEGLLKSPLNEASQLKWPHTLGFLFLRFEGKYSAAADKKMPTRIHMGSGSGDDRFAPQISISGPVDVGGKGPQIDLSLSVNELLKGSMMETDLSTFSLPPSAGPLGEEIMAGERLRRHSRDVKIFSRK
jgi:hypothetical protein